MFRFVKVKLFLLPFVRSPLRIDLNPILVCFPFVIIYHSRTCAHLLWRPDVTLLYRFSEKNLFVSTWNEIRFLPFMEMALEWDLKKCFFLSTLGHGVKNVTRGIDHPDEILLVSSHLDITCRLKCIFWPSFELITPKLSRQCTLKFAVIQ